MRPPSFDFERPSSIAEAVRAIGESDDGMFYSGGTELLLAMKMRIIHTDRLVDIKDIRGLDRIVINDANEIEVGARCTHNQIAENSLIRECVPSLSALCGDVANVRVRSVGTIGGNLCFGEPHADPPTLLAALDARLFLEGPDGVRVVLADNFIRGELETVREPNELLTTIAFPRPTGPVTYRRFKHGERPAVNVAMSLSLDSDGHAIKDARVRVGALGSRPQSLRAVEGAILHMPVTEARSVIAGMLPDALDELEVNADRHGSADYKRHIAGTLLMRNVEDAIAVCGRR